MGRQFNHLGAWLCGTLTMSGVRLGLPLLDINAGIADVEGIGPQPVRPDDRSTYWVWGATLSDEAFTCSAQEFVDALVAEGLYDFLGSRGLNGRAALMNNNPFLSEPHLYGRSHTPLDIGWDRPCDYKKVSLPIAEDQARRRIFFQVRPTYTEDDVGDIIYAIRKVAIHYQTSPMGLNYAEKRRLSETASVPKVHDQLSRLAGRHNVARADLLYLGAAAKGEYPVEFPAEYV